MNQKKDLKKLTGFNFMFKYSDKLIQETIKNFKEEASLDISEETTNEYCNQLASLFLAFAKKMLRERINLT